MPESSLGRFTCAQIQTNRLASENQAAGIIKQPEVANQLSMSDAHQSANLDPTPVPLGA